MSKTIEEIKDKVAFDYGHRDWRELEKEYERENISFEHVYKEVSERYAQSKTQELQEQNAELIDLLKGIVKQIEKGEKIGGINLLTTSSIEYEYAQKLLTKHNHLKSNTNG